MSATEPPSRNAPRNQPHDTKAARDELSSKGKVEKVREIDADEQTRKNKFLKFYKDDAIEDENAAAESRPSPFDLLSGKPATSTSTEGPLGSSGSPVGDDVQDAIVPGPNNSPPPSVNSFEGQGIEAEDGAVAGALPQSGDFWNRFGMPDQPMLPANFQEGPPQQAQGQAAPAQKGAVSKSASGMAAGMAIGAKGAKTQEPSLFGPPGKPVVGAKGGKSAEKPVNEPVRSSQTVRPKENQTKKSLSPFEPPPKKSFQKEKEPQRIDRSARREPAAKERTEEETYTGPVSGQTKVEKSNLTEKLQEEGYLSQQPGAIPFKPEDSESGGKRDQGKDKKTMEIEAPSLPSLPASIQPMATEAAMQAAPYLAPAAVPLFFQMVGTIFAMTGPQGINRTEIVLNNPSYARSKFFGATITIEKYASAPDSFNIRLTGSHEAVASFKENIPSLMNAFENGNYAFKVHRIDVEYSLERPIFRRKEKSEDKGEAGGGDLGERRK